MKEMKMNPDGELEEVIWKPVANYVGLYDVNQFGDVRSNERHAATKGGGVRLVSERLLLKNKRSSNLGNVPYGLHKDGTTEYFGLNRIVAEAFLGVDKNDKTKIVTFIDKNPNNTYYKNLVSMSPDYFYHHFRDPSRSIAIIAERDSVTNVEDSSPNIIRFDSIADAAKYFRHDRTTIRNRLRYPDRYYDNWKFRYELTEDIDVIKGDNPMKKLKEMKKNPDGEMEEVIWKPIKGWEGFYSVNQFGDVKFHKRRITCRNGVIKHFPDHTVERRTDKFNNSSYVQLTADGFKRKVTINNLVAETFLNFDASDKCVLVRPIDGNRNNYYYKNLRIGYPSLPENEHCDATDQQQSQTKTETTDRISPISEKEKEVEAIPVIIDDVIPNAIEVRSDNDRGSNKMKKLYKVLFDSMIEELALVSEDDIKNLNVDENHSGISISIVLNSGKDINITVKNPVIEV